MEKTIVISGRIGSNYYGYTMDKLLAELVEDKVSVLDVVIFSGGGDMSHGLAMYDVLKQFDGTLNTYGIGLVASAGTLILTSGDKVAVTSQTPMMVHNGRLGEHGDKNDLKKAIKVLEVFDEIGSDLYMRKTGLSREEVEAMMDEETWMTPRRALELGFVDEVLDELPKGLLSQERMLRNINYNDYYDIWFENMDTQVQNCLSEIGDVPNEILNLVKKTTPKTVFKMKDIAKKLADTVTNLIGDFFTAKDGVKQSDFETKLVNAFTESFGEISEKVKNEANNGENGGVTSEQFEAMKTELLGKITDVQNKAKEESDKLVGEIAKLKEKQIGGSGLVDNEGNPLSSGIGGGAKGTRLEELGVTIKLD